jgi:NADH-quinone oxidoreductase subunit N
MAACFYIAAYAAMNVGIFAVVTLASGYDEKLPVIDDFRGLIYRSPLLGSLLIFFLASLVGIPFTGGFMGKLISFSTALSGGAIWLVILGLLNSGLAAAYYLRLALAAARRPILEGKETLAPPQVAPRVGAAVIAALAMAVLATLVLGIIPGDTLRAAEAGAHTLKAPPVESSTFGNAVEPPTQP